MKDSLIQYDTMQKKIKLLNLSKKAKENINIYYTNAIIQKLRELRKKEQNEYIKEIKNREMIKNIKIRRIKQLIKRLILSINIKLYLKLS